jgi:hypothetical protein
MALSIQQQIASIKNQLAQLEDRIKEENSKVEKTFTITFEYKTDSEFWGGEEPTSFMIFESIAHSFNEIHYAMQIGDGLTLKEVKEV